MVDKFKFRHVAFVDKPAYGPLATVKETCTAQDFRYCNFAAAVDALRLDIKKAPPSSKNYMQTEDEFKAKCAQLDALLKEHGELKANHAKLKADFDGVQKIESDRLAQELKARASKVAEARISMGLAKQEEKDTFIASLEKMGADVLDVMLADLVAMQTKVAEAQSSSSDRVARAPAISFKAAGAKDSDASDDNNAAQALKELMFGGN